ncbi:MAG: hypothetical protein IPJ77_09415 [Planctomycetes bacterium]|nr:hypothetical protein [Planctomycetota bacterium]
MGYGLALACKKAELDTTGRYTLTKPGQTKSTGSTADEVVFVSGDRLYRTSISTSPELFELRAVVESLDTATGDQNTPTALTPSQRQWIEDYFNSTLALLTTPERDLPR